MDTVTEISPIPSLSNIVYIYGEAGWVFGGRWPEETRWPLLEYQVTEGLLGQGAHAQGACAHASPGKMYDFPGHAFNINSKGV